MSPLRVALLGAAGLVLTACGSVAPGAAATVDGQTISMSTLDDAARVYCEVSAFSAQQQGVQEINNTAVRQQAASDLVVARVAKDIAGERGLKIPPPTELDPVQFEDAFGSRAPAVAREISASQDLYRLLAVIGGNDAATVVTDANSEALADAGRTLVLQAFGDHDVRFSPRLGLSDAGAATGSNGSLSVAAAANADPEKIPTAARCTV